LALTRQDKIDRLNQRVAKITAKEVLKVQQNSNHKITGLAPEFVHAQQPMTFWTAGTPVYQKRSALLVYVYAILATAFVLKGCSMLHPLTSLVCFVIMFIGYDFYSGILHVVLDHPDNIAIPILGQPCLEFQWHHAIPDDIVRKDFVDVCGDLNVVVLILAVINLVLLDDVGNNGMAMLLLGLKLWMAYYGQFSHRSAHALSYRRRYDQNGGGADAALSSSTTTTTFLETMVVPWLQSNGFMITPKHHTLHHKAPNHDVDFCLIGICNPVIDGLRTITTHNGTWIMVLFVWSIFDVVGYVQLVQVLCVDG
jgi:hypothetical protein